jgi:hypothetical protein
VVFEHVIDALVHGSGYERIATRACSDRTIRRRLKQWAGLGLAERLHAVALAAYDLKYHHKSGQVTYRVVVDRIEQGCGGGSSRTSGGGEGTV